MSAYRTEREDRTVCRVVWRTRTGNEHETSLTMSVNEIVHVGTDAMLRRTVGFLRDLATAIEGANK